MILITIIPSIFFQRKIIIQTGKERKEKIHFIQVICNDLAGRKNPFKKTLDHAETTTTTSERASNNLLCRRSTDSIPIKTSEKRKAMRRTRQLPLLLRGNLKLRERDSRRECEILRWRRWRAAVLVVAIAAPNSQSLLPRPVRCSRRFSGCRK
jgi:hypothetical protein